MGFDLGALGVAIASVLVVGLLLGAGIPLIYALAIRSLESHRPGSTAAMGALWRRRIRVTTRTVVDEPGVRRRENLPLRRKERVPLTT